MSKLRRACTYIRVSREREDGISPEQQKEKAELQARLMGLDLLRIYQDIDISGRSDRRPGFQEMISDIKAGLYDICMVYKLDRFCRNVKDFHHYVEVLESHDCSLVSISQNIDTSTPVGRLLRNILADFAQFESEMIAERVRDNKLAAARRGRWNGGHIPYGYELQDKQLVINPQEAPAIVLAFEMRAAGNGYLKIAKELTARGFAPRHGTRRGLHWSEDSVKYIIGNPVYMGVLEYDGIAIPGAVPAIVEAELWHRAQAPRQIPNRAQQSPHLLSGLLYCTHCGHSGWAIVKNGRVYYDSSGNWHGRVLRYMCRTRREMNAAACATRLLDKYSLEDKIIELVFCLADDATLLAEARRALSEAIATREDTATVEQIKAELDRLRAVMRELFADYYDHRLITREQFAQKNGEYLEKEKMLVDKLEQLEAAAAEQTLANAELMASTAAALRQDWENMTDGEKKLALRQVIKRIDVYPDRVVVDFFGVKKEITPKVNSGATLFF
ncbi:MAG: recombinase family protein [Desulfurispora sp.]|uniref:recombinase family protein n=1 Tax=Desulfurispora sp. TaxID=3014275 RepID=UPI0040490717